MSIIICPYCFREVEDDKVHFRSMRASKEENNPLPPQYRDVEDFTEKYEGSDKQNILKKYEAWDFFRVGADEKYETFWERYGSTSENDPADAVFGIKAYQRKVIDPLNEAHQEYIKEQPNGTCFIRDPQNDMVVGIELTTGEECRSRVCPHCHNPFPDNYGKYTAKFVTIVGVAGAGKTVFLSQLLENMAAYAANVGLTAYVGNASVMNFRRENRVEAGKPLPGSTPEVFLQQPLFYEIERSGEGNQKITETLVMYDVAGEVITDSAKIDVYAPFIRNSDGLIVLIDPLQFQAVKQAGMEGERKEDPITVLQTIHTKILKSGQDANEKNTMPMAVCISKIDIPVMTELLGAEVSGRLQQKLAPVRGANGFCKTVFNASQYNPIAKALNEYFMQNAYALAQAMMNSYTEYAWFAFSALGCDVEEKQTENGTVFETPVGPVIPRHLEEPMLWLFYELGYISANEEIFSPLPQCPKCRSKSIDMFDTVTNTNGFGPFKKTWQYNCRCRECGNEWLSEDR